MSEETTTERIQRERRERIQANRERQAIEKQAREDARQFSVAVALRKSAGNGTPIRQDTTPTRTQSTTGEGSKGDPVQPQLPSPRGIPLEFYCYVNGKIGTVSLYAMANPQQI